MYKSKSSQVTARPAKDLYEVHEFFILFILVIIYFLKDDPVILGLDYRYYLLVCWLPFGAGVLTFALIKFRHVRKLYLYDNSIPRKNRPALVGLYLFMSAVFSFFTFNLIADIVWIEKNKAIANERQTELKECSIERFSKSRRRYNVKFHFNNKIESVRIEREEFYKFKDKNISDFRLLLKVRKSFENYYITDDWMIEDIKNEKRIIKH